jgi:predicted nuclease of restriction endonuclease-like (RecB) superfamily
MAKKPEEARSRGRPISGNPAVPEATCQATGTRLDALYRQVREILEQARATAARSVNTAMVRAYWLIGRKVVEEEQAGSARAGYGDELIDQLAARLRADFGRGFTPSNLRYMRLFYLAYPNLLAREIHHAVRDKSERGAGERGRQAVACRDLDRGVLNPDLSWTHYRLLTKVQSPLSRDFYEIEAVRNHWSSRELERQINSLLFEHLAKSRDKKGLLRLALKGQEIKRPEDVFKDPLVFEFAGIPESPRLVESELEEALISNLQSFLLELGQGFAFVARQKRITLDGDHFYIDLVFYHIVLKCHIIIDVKVEKLTHADIVQIQLYVNYYDETQRTAGDNPTLGLILCVEKNDLVVRYTLGKENRRIFASRYKLHLPSEEELAEEIRRELRGVRGGGTS